MYDGYWLLSVSIAVCAVAAAGGGDWPQYRGPNRDGTVPALPLPERWPAQLTVRWQFPVGEGFSSPAVVDDNVYLISGEGEQEAVRCLDAADGRTRWEFSYKARFRSPYGDGPRATPLVDGGRVYTVGGTGEMYCLGATDGKPIWHKSFSRAFSFRVPTYGHSASPLIDGEVLYVHAGGRRGDSVVSLNKHTGEVIWQALDDPAGYASPIMIPASPRTGPRQLIVFTEYAVASLGPANGSPFWRYPWTTSFAQNVASPIVQGDLLVVTTLSGTAALRLRSEGGRPQFEQAWRQGRLVTHFSCPVAADGLLYLPHGRRPELRCIEVESGRELWRRDLPARNRCGMVLAGQVLFVYTDRGTVLVLQVSRRGCDELARYELAGRNWVPPVLARGCLWLRDHRSLKCVELPLEAVGE